ncbi:unnamed protein product [Sphenostylis stenocarpa]|uniref:Pentatricopeptide repeat-containing protein n=1 Tax=Sphenostylis stenocarpa TaxID=92480 RepID=A0AA86SDZ0_9FABA|nr:unnamed protein product [Sphenostylis stenocarpa]
MPLKNEISYNAMLAGNVQDKKMDIAREFFEAMPCRKIISWTTMITGYCQNGGIAQARKLFDVMPQRNCVSWAAIIAGYAQNEHFEEALNMFVEMKRDGENSNSTDEANNVFEGIEEKDVVSWNIKIAGYARHEFGRQALILFESKKKAGVKPDEITMLCACMNRYHQYFIFYPVWFLGGISLGSVNWKGLGWN